MSHASLRVDKTTPELQDGTMRAWIGAISVSITACVEPADGWFDTEHLRVRGHAGAELCAGTPILLEREVVRLTEALQLPEPDEPIHVLIGPNAGEGCAAPNLAGCAGRADDGGMVVLSQYPVVGHELVHAVRQVAGASGPSFYEEGLAELYGAGAVSTVVLDEVAYDPDRIDALQLEHLGSADAYDLALSFVAWLHEQSDPAEFAWVFAGPPYSDLASRDELERWFEDDFGLSLAAATREWARAAPPARVLPGPCLVNEPIVPMNGFFSDAGVLDCGDVRTVGPSVSYLTLDLHQHTISRCVDIRGADFATLDLDAPAGVHIESVLRRCDNHEPESWNFVSEAEIELELGSDYCWLELRVTGELGSVADYRWTLTLR